MTEVYTPESARREPPRNGAEIIDLVPLLGAATQPPPEATKPAPSWSIGDRVIGHIRGRTFRGHVELVSIGTREPRVGVRVFGGTEGNTMKVVDARDLTKHEGSFIQ